MRFATNQYHIGRNSKPYVASQAEQSPKVLPLLKIQAQNAVVHGEAWC